MKFIRYLVKVSEKLSKLYVILENHFISCNNDSSIAKTFHLKADIESCSMKQLFDKI